MQNYTNSIWKFSYDVYLYVDKLVDPREFCKMSISDYFFAKVDSDNLESGPNLKKMLPPDSSVPTGDTDFGQFRRL